MNAAWPEIARSQHGVIALTQLLANGATRSTVNRWVHSSALDRVAQGVYLVRGAPLTYAARLWVAVLATGGALGFHTAAHLWGIEEGPARRVHVVLPPERRVHIPEGVRVLRVLTSHHRQDRQDGFPITTRRQTVLDHLGLLAPAGAQRLADRALQREWITVPDMTRFVSDNPGRRGNVRLRALAAQCGDGAAAQSERLLHTILRRAGLNGWQPNYRVWVDGTLVAVLDVAIEECKLALEIDGWAYHSDVDRFQRDRSRQNRLVLLGWTVLRFTWADLVERPALVARTIRTAAA